MNKMIKPGYTHQERYILEHRKHHHEVTIWRILIFIIFLFLWEFASYKNWIDSFFFSSPARVYLCFLDLIINNQLMIHIGITLMETIISFLLVILLSLGISTLLWYSTKLSEIVEPYLVILNSLPKSALAPLFIVWLGTGIKTIIVAGISVALFGSVISFYTGFLQVDKAKLTLIKTLGGKRIDAYLKVVLPSCIPLILSSCKVNIGLSLVGVIIGEFLAARRGLGYLIIYGAQVFQLDMVITAIIILCIIAWLFYQSIQLLEHHIKKKYANKK